MSHQLDHLLAPRSIALVGASERPDSAGRTVVEMARIDGFRGAVYPVNRRYQQIGELRCFADLASLPEVPDHVVLALANGLLEPALDDALALGVRAFTVFASGVVTDDRQPQLLSRIQSRLVAAGAQLVGPNCMGFYNPPLGLRIASFPAEQGLRPGGIAWIAGSGSAFSALCHNDRRLGFSLVVSSGGELVTSIADYIDWSLDQSSTRVIGLFLEQIRAPDRFVAALERAADANIPVVALKVGRTARSAAMALTHTGALAGNHSAVAALFQRHGVIEVDDLDEMVATLQLFDMPRRFAKGGLATVHDSGGERELLVDLAAAEGVRFGEISDATKAAIAPNLEAGLVADNPLDAWGTDKDYSSRYARSLGAMLDDDDVAGCGFFSEVRVDYWYSRGIVDAVRTANGGSAKPCFIASNTWTTRDEPIATALAAEGIPVLKGSRNALRAVGNVMSRRDFKRWPQPISALGLAKGIRARLASGARIGEAEALMMLATLGMTVPKLHLAMSLDGAIGAAADIGFPVALKTAEDHAHKSDVGGVRVNLADRATVAAAYVEMAARLGPRVMVAAMAPAGIEIGLGGIVDPDFGPVVLVSAGGIHVEQFDDKIPALAPFGDDEAHELLRRLKVHRLLLGARGRPAADIGATAHAIALFSQILAGVASEITEIDVNPLIAAPQGAFAVDCLIVNKPRGTA